ncbi:hypothetical protein EJ06DRAFT_127770 [Trichodelitschia bisporula]|uniref:Uncharacterized protein n=1 Tax=Trichodelitschia bisporula TaxID=703511 RepID=A0A6G1HQ85_9PEZI|nr:hypothetical protein EJ06DRAFT_127770 [Trichodelitschia bisporula]
MVVWLAGFGLLRNLLCMEFGWKTVIGIIGMAGWDRSFDRCLEHGVRLEWNDSFEESLLSVEFWAGNCRWDDGMGGWDGRAFWFGIGNKLERWVILYHKAMGMPLAGVHVYVDIADRAEFITAMASRSACRHNPQAPLCQHEA